MTNTLAYYDTDFIVTLKSCIVSAPRKLKSPLKSLEETALSQILTQKKPKNVFIIRQMFDIGKL